MEIASPYSLSRRVPSATRPPLRGPVADSGSQASVKARREVPMPRAGRPRPRADPPVPMPARRQLGSATDSLALVARVLALAAQPGEDALAVALARETAGLLNVPAAGVITLPRDEGEGLVAPAAGAVRPVAADRLEIVARLAAGDDGHACLRGAE